MKLNDLDIAKLLPAFMRDDTNFKALIYAIEDKFKQLYETTQLIRLYKNIDNLPEWILDELAWQFNAIEYSESYSLSIKRKLIKECLLTHHRRGTTAAVEDVAENIFGNATVSEWFDYNGSPYHFKVYTTNISTSDDMIQSFRRTIQNTQNIRSYLDEIIAETSDSMDIYYGCVLGSNDWETFSTVDYEPINSIYTDLFYVHNSQVYLNTDSTEEPVNLIDSRTGTIYKCSVDSSTNKVSFTETTSDTYYSFLQIMDIDTVKKTVMYILDGNVVLGYGTNERR